VSRSLLIYAPAARAGGPLRYLQRAVPKLARAWDGDVILVAPRESHGDLSGDPELNLLEAPPREDGGPLGNFIATQRHATRVIRRIAPAVVFFLGNVAYAGRRFPNVTLVQNAATLRDLRHASLRTWKSKSLARAALAATTHRSHAIICVSQYTADVMPIRPRGARVAIIGHGVDHPRLVPAPAAGALTSQDVIIPGGISPYKDLEAAIRAMVSVDQYRRLHIVGGVADKRYSHYCRDLVRRLRLEESVRFWGLVPHARLTAMMGEAGAVLLTSRAEAGPNVLFEAAATNPGRPIIGIKRRWNEEYCQFFDVLTEASCLHSVLNSIPAVSNADTRRMREQALAVQTWDRTVAETLEVLSAVSRGDPWGASSHKRLPKADPAGS
jgi:glycosyltransferase involved in cell wall biosynthesis